MYLKITDLLCEGFSPWQAMYLIISWLWKLLSPKSVEVYIFYLYFIWFFKKFCLFGFLTSSSTTKLYLGRAPRHSVWQFYVLPHMRQSWETMTSVSAGHIILTPTQTVGSGRPQRESNPGPPHQESRALPTELPRPRFFKERSIMMRTGLCFYQCSVMFANWVKSDNTASALLPLGF